MKTAGTDRYRRIQAGFRWVLAGFMLFAGVMHFAATESFLGQVPTWLPERTFIVQASGVVEIAFGLALLLARGHRRQVGWALAGFFVLVFPGNVYQAVVGTDAFGLDTPGARWLRLAFQPVLILWALWATDAIPTRRRSAGRRGG
jgi:uncharacterized membrane protein